MNENEKRVNFFNLLSRYGIAHNVSLEQANDLYFEVERLFKVDPVVHVQTPAEAEALLALRTKLTGQTVSEYIADRMVADDNICNLVRENEKIKAVKATRELVPGTSLRDCMDAYAIVRASQGWS